MDNYEHSLPEDYYTKDLYEMWKKMEKTQIVKDITSLQSSVVINNSNQKILTSKDYYFIPPEPYLAFKQLVELCMFKDCDSSFEGEDILSENSKNLIQECEFRWRIPKSFKDIIILDILIQNYINNFIGINDISDFLQKFIDSIDNSDNIRIHEVMLLKYFYFIKITYLLIVIIPFINIYLYIKYIYFHRLNFYVQHLMD